MVRMKLVLSFAAVLAFALTSQAQADISRKSLAWTLGSDVSLAAIMNARGGSKKLVDQRYAAAVRAATALGTTVPELPVNSGESAKDSAAALRYILVTAGAPLGRFLQGSFGAEHAAIFEIALKSNTLLILYGPGEKTADTVAGVIRSRRPTAALPEALTEPLLTLIARQASFDTVKAELFSMHRSAPDFITITELDEIGELRYKQKDFTGSAAAFSKAIKIDAGGPEHYFGRARALMQLDRHAEAIADYSKVITLQRDSPSVQKNLPLVYHNRGLCYGILGKNAIAISDLNKAVALRPDYASAYKVRALVHKRMGNLKLAEADLQKAESLQPGITR